MVKKRAFLRDWYSEGKSLHWFITDKSLKIKIADLNFSVFLREGLKKMNKKMVGFIQRSSDPSQPGRALDKKNSKIQNRFYFFEDKIDICFF